MPLREEAKTPQPSRQEEREKQEKRRLELQRKVAAMAESKGEVHRQVLEKIEELRHDRMQREEFDQYVGSLRQRPDEKYVKDNIKAVSNVSPLEFAQQPVLLMDPMTAQAISEQTEATAESREAF